MAAPKGNRFWEARSSHGRKPIFESPEHLWEACCEYFTWVDDNPLYETKAFAYQGEVTQEAIPKMRAMTISGLCIFLDIGMTTWEQYRTREDFKGIVAMVERIIRNQKFTGAAADLLNSNIIARDLGLAERSEHTGKDGGPIQTEETTSVETARRLAFLLQAGAKDAKANGETAAQKSQKDGAEG